jgi:chromate reductase, NAD(P)H dehydrogenase (quinone)
MRLHDVPSTPGRALALRYIRLRWHIGIQPSAYLITYLGSMRVLALSGSLRAVSINSSLLRATARLAPKGVTVNVFSGLGELPLYNPDIERNPPATIVALHNAVAESDAIVFASPEYAHGVTGTIKNALDWLVGFEPFANKLVAVLNTSPRAHHADDALRETLKTMAAVVVESASISVALLGSGLDESGMVATPTISEPVSAALCELQRAFESQRNSAVAQFRIR